MRPKFLIGFGLIVVGVIGYFLIQNQIPAVSGETFHFAEEIPLENKKREPTPKEEVTKKDETPKPKIVSKKKETISPPKIEEKQIAPKEKEVPPPLPKKSNKLVISEIQLTGGVGKTENDFIELYNPNDESVDISGWKLRKRTQSGKESSIRVFEKGQNLQPHAYLLWANSGNGYAETLHADSSSTASLAENASIALFDKEGNIIDAVAWGEKLINPFGEGDSILTKLKPNQSFERKNCNTGSASTSLCDTNNNQNDFNLREISSPKSTTQ